jgi:hypothetical protein
MATANTNNLVLGRGKLYFSHFKTGTETPSGFFYIGNTPEFTLNIESDDLDHFSSDEGIREKDDSVPLEVTRSGTLVTDNISKENVALFFFGTSADVSQVAVASSTEIFLSILNGRSYQLGITPTLPGGYVGIDPAGFAIVEGVTPLVVDVDYTMNFDTGFLTLLPGSIIAVDGVDLDVTYAVLASTRGQVISGTTPIEGALKYESANPKGDQGDFYFGKVTMKPNGDYALKGDDWQTLPLSIEVLKPCDGEAIIRNGRPVFP